MESAEVIKLVYIHGFRGDHTSFQSFPVDLHRILQRRFPPSLEIDSCLYPTYKSRKPITDIAKRFISWLETQPPGPVILLAHSMGGLLAAEVATNALNTSKRVIGIVAFDVPFLGMHPHVVISGIASLLSEEDDKRETEKDLNDDAVVKHLEIPMTDPGRDSSDTDIFQLISTSKTDDTHSVSSVSSQTSLSLVGSSPPNTGSYLDAEWESHKASFASKSSSSLTLANQFRRSPSPSSKSENSASSTSPPSGSSLLSQFSTASSSLVGRVAGRIIPQQDHPFMRWIQKHSDSPLRSMATWIVEHFEFGICMFDPSGLRERYTTLENWDRPWVNFWTETTSQGNAIEPGENTGKISDDVQNEMLPDNTTDIVRLAEAHQLGSSEAYAHAKATEKAVLKERDAERDAKKPRPARHFIVLPHFRDVRSNSWHFGSGENWECIQISNASDEVEAHCGLFIRNLNPNYDLLLNRVADIVEGWCSNLVKGN